MIFDPSAFDFLEGKGQQEQEVDIRRTSLLLRFDPLCQQLQQDKPKTNSLVLNELKEEELIPENEVVVAPLLNQSPGIQITAKSVKVSTVVIRDDNLWMNHGYFGSVFSEE